MRYDLQWFAQDGEGGEKTEPATQKKLNDARKEGKVAKSKELTSAFMLIALFLILKIFISYIGNHLVSVFDIVYNRIGAYVNPAEIGFTSQAVSSFMTQMILQLLQNVWPFFFVWRYYRTFSKYCSSRLEGVGETNAAQAQQVQSDQWI